MQRVDQHPGEPQSDQIRHPDPVLLDENRRSGAARGCQLRQRLPGCHLSLRAALAAIGFRVLRVDLAVTQIQVAHIGHGSA
ncbi:hypothetical protein MBRU_16740 [Mycolicibacterium brumae DSM 44177]|nr:hypothetical protein MBRU_16740 [Mycolicibacterium brumae DSM 44177]